MPNTETEILIQVNGEQQTIPPATPLVELLARLNFNPRLIALEYNGEILHRQYWNSTYLKSGDRLEIVTIVGGG